MNPKWKKKVYRKRKAPRRLRVLGTGGFTVTRLAAPIYVSNSSVVGQPQQNPTAAVSGLTLGAAVSNPLVSGHYDLPFTMSFNLAQIPGFTDFTNIADRYKITKVQVKVLYNANAIAGSAALGTFPSMLPIVNYITDHDDDGMLTAVQLREKMGIKSKTTGNGKYVKFSVVPKPANVLAPGTVYAVPTKPQWINAAYTTVPHFGIKGYFQNLNLQTIASATSCFTFELKYTVKLADLQ